MKPLKGDKENGLVVNIRGQNGLKGPRELSLNQRPQQHTTKLALEQKAPISTDKATVFQFISKGKEAEEANDFPRALKEYSKAKSYDLSFKPGLDVKLEKRIAKLERAIAKFEKLANGFYRFESGDFVLDPFCSSPFWIQADIFSKLYQHQIECLLWLWGLHKEQKGGILGDDMGLGKTVQIASFLGGLFYSQLIQNVLILLPKSLISQWIKECAIWAPGVFVTEFKGSTKLQKEKVLTKLLQIGSGICVITYGMIPNHVDMLNTVEWDYIILDEGHKIRNQNLTSKSVNKVEATHKLLLSGTPIMNCLHELWCLFDYVSDGQLLGDKKTFKADFETPIEVGNDKKATDFEKQLGFAATQTLRNRIKPYFLRREKQEVFKTSGGESTDQSSTPSLQEGPKKNEVFIEAQKRDFVVWCFLNPIQLELYKKYLQSEEVSEVVHTIKHSPLVAIGVLRKICDHPHRFLKPEEPGNHDLFHVDETIRDVIARSRTDDVQTMIQHSGKLTMLVKLLRNLHSEGHRVLIFSNFVKMLNIIQTVLIDEGYRFSRIDGSTEAGERERQIANFSTDMDIFCFMLTTAVGGLGLNLTTANRVIIYDPHWTSASDEQAVDRVYRIGQTKDVVVYRFITCGTIEEKMHRKQVHKRSLTKTTIEKTQAHHRYFTKSERSELFTLDDPTESGTHKSLYSKFKTQPTTSCPELTKHMNFLTTECPIFGISDYNLLFSEELEQVVATPEARALIQRAEKTIEKTTMSVEAVRAARRAEKLPETSRGRNKPQRAYQELDVTQKKRTPREKETIETPMKKEQDIIDLTDSNTSQFEDEPNEILDDTMFQSTTTAQRKRTIDSEEEDEEEIGESEENAIITHFCAQTGTCPEEALDWISTTGGDVNLALARFSQYQNACHPYGEHLQTQESWEPTERQKSPTKQDISFPVEDETEFDPTDAELPRLPLFKKEECADTQNTNENPIEIKAREQEDEFPNLNEIEAFTPIDEALGAQNAIESNEQFLEESDFQDPEDTRQAQALEDGFLNLDQIETFNPTTDNEEPDSQEYSQESKDAPQALDNGFPDIDEIETFNPIDEPIENATEPKEKSLEEPNSQESKDAIQSVDDGFPDVDEIETFNPTTVDTTEPIKEALKERENALQALEDAFSDLEEIEVFNSTSDDEEHSFESSDEHQEEPEEHSQASEEESSDLEEADFDAEKVEHFLEVDSQAEEQSEPSDEFPDLDEIEGFTPTSEEEEQSFEASTDSQEPEEQSQDLETFHHIKDDTTPQEDSIEAQSFSEELELEAEPQPQQTEDSFAEPSGEEPKTLSFEDTEPQQPENSIEINTSEEEDEFPNLDEIEAFDPTDDEEESSEATNPKSERDHKQITEFPKEPTEDSLIEPKERQSEEDTQSSKDGLIEMKTLPPEPLTQQPLPNFPDSISTPQKLPPSTLYQTPSPTSRFFGSPTSPIDPSMLPPPPPSCTHFVRATNSPLHLPPPPNFQLFGHTEEL